jgi:hypothetical protein
VQAVCLVPALEVRVSLGDFAPTNVDEPTQRLSVVDTGRHHQVEVHDGDSRRQLAMAWRQADRYARALAHLYQRTEMPMTPAFVESHPDRRRARVWFAVWLLSRFEPAKRVYTETLDGRARGTTMTPEVPGVALLPDGQLVQYRLVKRHPMLTVPLQQARPESPPGYEVFRSLGAKAMGRS